MSNQLPLRQTLQPCEDTGDDLPGYQKAASEKYPGETPSDALEKYAREFRVPGLFFQDDEGVRCTWGADIEDKFRKYDKLKQVRVDDRHYLIRPKPKTLKQIDKPRSTSYHNLVAHPSETGWARPYRHRLHFDKLPQEIKDCIFGFVLTVPGKVEPYTVISNWKTNYCQPHYEVCEEPEFSEMTDYSSIVWIRRRDRDGLFCEMRAVKKPAIDATLLRTCKDFYNNGMNILYGKNRFTFKPNEYSFKESPFTLLGTSTYIQFRPNPGKPSMRFADWDSEVREGICQIRLCRPVEMLCGWIYFDPFLRFLHTIGASNAAMLKHLNFTGVVKLHQCGWTECSKCEQDLLIGLELYIPFIIQFCTGLESLSINCLSDRAVWGYGSHGRHPQDPSPATCEEALQPLLENELLQIQTLVNLEVITPRYVSTGGSYDSYEDRRADFVEPSIEWFKKRGNKASDPKNGSVEEAGIQHGQLICDFCREDHVWAGCHNLCDFCGQYGHFRSTCITLHAMYEEQGVPIYKRE